MPNKINNSFSYSTLKHYRRREPHYDYILNTYKFRRRYADMYTNGIGHCNNHVCANCGEHL
jgi:hypothetical protein